MDPGDLGGSGREVRRWRQMRAWLALRHADVPFRFHDVGLKTREGWKDRILAFSGAGKVPVLVDGASSVHEALAIGETVAERVSPGVLWPEDASLRARGRAISCEMATSFVALRSELQCNLRARSRTPALSEAARSDVARIVDIFSASLDAGNGPYLLGAFSIADCMYAPVATRFRTYDVALPETAARYVQTILAHPAMLELEAIAKDQPAIAEYDVALIARD